MQHVDIVVGRSRRGRRMDTNHPRGRFAADDDSGNADLDALIRSGKGDIPLVRLAWRCANCRSGMTDFVVTGAHFGPHSRA